MSNDATPPVDLFESRRHLSDQFPVVDQAFSAGGRQAQLIAGLGSAVDLGSLVVSDDERGEPLVAQVHSQELAERPVGQIDAPVDLAMGDGAAARTLSLTPMARFVRSDLTVLGRLRGGTFVREVPAEGFRECRFRAATDDEIREVRAALAGSAPTIAVGEVAGSPAVEARLRSAGFSRHTFLCGQSGSGKTYATGVLLERLRLGTDLPLVVFDPNSDHVHLGALRDDARDAPEAARYRALADQVLVARARGHHEGALLAIHFSDLARREQTLLLGLDPVVDLALTSAFRQATAELAVPFSAADVRDAAAALGTGAGLDLATRIDNLEVAEWGVWSRPGEPSLVEAAPLQRRCLVVDLGSLERAQERTLVALALLRYLWARRAEKLPVLLVVDEAHNAFPSHPTNALEAAASAVGVSIAAEGRKYGLHLLLATQRPSKVEANVVTQCDNLVLLRVNATADVDDLCRTFSHVPPGLIAQAPEFGLGELLLAGPIAEVPLRARIGRRLSPEGGGDLPTDWATPADR